MAVFVADKGIECQHLIEPLLTIQLYRILKQCLRRRCLPIGKKMGISQVCKMIQLFIVRCELGADADHVAGIGLDFRKKFGRHQSVFHMRQVKHLCDQRGHHLRIRLIPSGSGLCDGVALDHNKLVIHAIPAL